MLSSTPNYATRLLGGLASYLAANNVVSWDEFETDEEKAYDAETEWPTFPGPAMPMSPDEVVVLTVYNQTFLRADVVTSIQIRLRGVADAGRAAVDDKAQAIHDLLYPNGFPLSSVSLGGIRVGAVIPGDLLPLDPDSARRCGSIQNIRIRSRRPRPE